MVMFDTSLQRGAEYAHSPKQHYVNDCKSLYDVCTVLIVALDVRQLFVATIA